MRTTTIFIFVFALVLSVVPVEGTKNGTIEDILNLTIFTGNWDAVTTDYIVQDRCDFPGAWYIITGVGIRHDDGDLRAKMYGVKWSGCKSHRGKDDLGSSTIHNHSDWCGKVYYPYVVTERVWNQQPQYAKNVLNNTTKFIGIIQNDWYNWHPYFGRPDDLPTSEVSNSKHIFGWITVSFENASIINGTMYVSNLSKVVPIYDVWNSVNGIERYERCENCESCEDMHAKLISMDETVTVDEKDGQVTATVHVVLKWGYFCWNCWPMNQPCRAMWMNTTEHAKFTCTVQAPQILTVNTTNVIAQITEYNNTFDPYSIIRVGIPENITTVSFKYRNYTANHYNVVGVVVGEHVAFTENSVWKVAPNQDLIVPYGEQCLIREAPINLSELEIQIHSPYHTENVTRCNITTVTSDPTDYVNFKLMFIYILLIGGLAFCAYANLKWVRR